MPSSNDARPAKSTTKRSRPLGAALRQSAVGCGIDSRWEFGYHRTMSKAETAQCVICGQTKSSRNGTIGEVVRPSLATFIRKKAAPWDGKGFICFDDLGRFRRDYVKEVLQDEIGELSALDQEVVESLQQHEILSSDISKQFEKKLTF